MRFWAAFILLCSSFALCQGNPPSPPAANDYSREGLVYEQTSAHYQFLPDGSNTHEVSVRVRVQSEAGLKQVGLLIFRYQRVITRWRWRRQSATRNPKSG